jgi:hypothetical protein
VVLESHFIEVETEMEGSLCKMLAFREAREGICGNSILFLQIFYKSEIGLKNEVWLTTNSCKWGNPSLKPGKLVPKHMFSAIPSTPLYQKPVTYWALIIYSVHHLMTGICSENSVVRQFHCCANTIKYLSHD